MDTEFSSPSSVPFAGKVKVMSVDGKVWDIVSAELKPTGDPVAPFTGVLYPEDGAAITDWAGRVQLLKPDGEVLEAMISPGADVGEHRAIEVTGLDHRAES
ncbi:MAG: hypothetical protein HKO10_03140 [Acidimicrobiia bacterium]|nr:hypothetical protein [Acidimicrobiia bacterium]